MDPERPIEKLLKAAAKKRRDQAGTPFELHPADRKVLQAEVGRKYAKAKRSSSFLQSLLVGWPRLVWGTAILAVLAIIAFMLVPDSNKTNPEAFMAQNTPMPVEETRREVSPAPVPTLDDHLGIRSDSPSSRLADLADKKLPEIGAISESPQPAPQPAGAPASSPMPATVALKQAEPALAAAPGLGEKPLSPPAQAPVLARHYGMLTAPSRVAAPSETPLASPPVASTELFKNSVDNSKLSLATKAEVVANTALTATDALAKTDNSNNDRQPTMSLRFTQIQQPTKAKTAKLETVPVSTRVLTAFQVEQVGDELRVIDGDGSVYTGRLVAPETLRARYAESKDSAAAAVTVQSSERSFQAGLGAAVQNYSFRVTGTNRSLNQNVVFSGNLAAGNNSISLNVTNSVSNALGAFQNSVVPQNSNLLLNSRISGRAQIGKGKEIQIEAVSEP